MSLGMGTLELLVQSWYSSVHGRSGASRPWNPQFFNIVLKNLLIIKFL